MIIDLLAVPQFLCWVLAIVPCRVCLVIPRALTLKEAISARFVIGRPAAWCRGRFLWPSLCMVRFGLFRNTRLHRVLRFDRFVFLCRQLSRRVVPVPEGQLCIVVWSIETFGRLVLLTDRVTGTDMLDRIGTGLFGRLWQ